MTYYKAVRPDGTSFHDRSFRWLPESGPVEGHTVTHPTASTVGEHASSYLSVSVTPTDCTGMRWPCRLFEVMPAGEVVTPEPDSLPNKRAAVAWQIVRELPATDALGPQGVQVAALIERADRLTDVEARRLFDAWDAAMGAEWHPAKTAAFAVDAARTTAEDTVWAAVHVAAGDAGLALVVRDLISVEHYDALTGPWRTIIGPIHPDDPDNN